jgi:hypothetical protein
MAIRTILITFVAAGLAAASAGAGVSSSPKDLLLKSSDLPAGAKRVAFGGERGAIKIPRTVHGRVAYVAYRFKSGSRTEGIGEAVGTLTNSRDAHDVYSSLKRKAAKQLKTFPRLALSKYGDEQFAVGVARPFAISVLIVRSGSVIWELVVSAYPAFSKRQLTAELSKYAAKANSRAG